MESHIPDRAAGSIEGQLEPAGKAELLRRAANLIIDGTRAFDPVEELVDDLRKLLKESEEKRQISLGRQELMEAAKKITDRHISNNLRARRERNSGRFLDIVFEREKD